MSIFGTVLGIVIIAALICWIVGYNALIKFLQWVEESWAQIETQLNRRVQAVPSLIDIAQPYAKQEQHTLEKIVELRSSLTSPNTSRREQLQINEELTKNLHILFAVKEEHPELHQHEEFQQLEDDLKDTEEKIHRFVLIYNNTVQKYNTKIHSMPVNFVADIHSFQERQQLNVPDGASKDVKLSS
ncbi:LemA family protein [Salibacterium halotolerans]|uniref:LemA protein n=1 Tax=Salibacterium halotolerans TaxID=1884432 RepID=A0A1I5UIY4_9BACI|nr:LemA family protein [Salibacterium halotolerans]SFP95017.1 LemA protein [Salibacterium halotolerans]